MTPHDTIQQTLAVMDAVQRIKSSGFTYCGYLTMLFAKAAKDDFEMVDSHYTADGVRSVLVDKVDGRKYEVTVKVMPKERG